MNGEPYGRHDLLVNRYLDAKAHEEKWHTVAEEAADEIIALVGVGNRYQMGKSGVRVEPPRRVFRAAQARLVLLPEQLMLASELVPTQAAADAHLPAPLVELCRVPDRRARVVRL